ncbi:MAG TPA: DUF2388 domain-containing protein [Pseudomonas sabulinigri]|uniref:Holliday junction resolvasome, helicase subunit n=1 Tax=marine sediment metagenome TaxID=412755 RepID=A0A0F9S7A8_9ZZZZ|nr:DUF2388 domain-containing protein [Halopseudomonas sabulinigri]HEC50318.1 DUF2388 domain-containing protein [Halopseudomonas sabulinigri]|tara:strand:+ start:24360 stop:24674 length:315 start_codon:yes stop_codon:yes gene_type:complete
MKRLSLLAAIGVFAFSGLASASSFVATTDTIGASLANSVEGTSDVSSGGNDKVLLQAQDDAASFVASGGSIRGVRLEAALAHIRQQQPALNASDVQLAEAILAR